jgi:hypothetical protein
MPDHDWAAPPRSARNAVISLSDLAKQPKRRKRGPGPSPRYEDDVYAWSLAQAELLRAGRLDEVDAKNVADEILDVGRNEHDKLESALRLLLVHMLKWDIQPEKRSRSWINTIAIQRIHALRQLRDNPSLKSGPAKAVDDAFRVARLEAENETGLEDAFPDTCPHDWDAILNRAFKL